ncbi:MAG: hypothetical protein H6Q05_740 [Acidobacteria bacterium]|nr:hypothetical protein [Acidobacteriota bacterium]
MMHREWTVWIFLGWLALSGGLQATRVKEFLTAQEIEKIQDAQEIDERVKVYLEAAALRLKTAADRLAGKESLPGDPLEFFSVEDMLDGYFRILRAVMMNIDDATSKPGTDPKKTEAALKNLKAYTEAALAQLVALKKVAEDQRREETWTLVGKAIEINNGAHDGAAEALSVKKLGAAGAPRSASGSNF